MPALLRDIPRHGLAEITETEREGGRREGRERERQREERLTERDRERERQRDRESGMYVPRLAAVSF